MLSLQGLVSLMANSRLLSPCSPVARLVSVSWETVISLTLPSSLFSLADLSFQLPLLIAAVNACDLQHSPSYLLVMLFSPGMTLTDWPSVRLSNVLHPRMLGPAAHSCTLDSPIWPYSHDRLPLSAVSGCVHWTELTHGQTIESGANFRDRLCPLPLRTLCTVHWAETCHLGPRLPRGAIDSHRATWQP